MTSTTLIRHAFSKYNYATFIASCTPLVCIVTYRYYLEYTDNKKIVVDKNKKIE